MHRWIVTLCVLAATADADAPRFDTIGGTVVSKTTGEPLAGATVVATPSKTDAGGSQVAITDETGWYLLDVGRGTFDVTVYYGDSTVELATHVVVDGQLRFAPVRIDETTQAFGCVFGGGGSPDLTSYPRLGFAATRGLRVISRDRTDRAWIAPVAGADPNTAVTTVGDGHRYARAPGIPIAFVEEVITQTLRIPIDQPAGAGGAADVALRSGSNETKGDAHLVLGMDRTGTTGGAELFTSGPIRQDKAWIAIGLVAQRDAREVVGGDSMVNAIYMPTPDHQIGVAGLAHENGDADRAAWASASHIAKLYDAKVELHTVATVEAMTLPDDATARATTPLGNQVDRAGAGSTLKVRFKASGAHELIAAAAGGAGTRDGDPHSDASFAIGDEWQLRPNLTITAGERSEFRRFETDRAWVHAPRAAITWDPTKEGRSDLFVAFQRVPHLDDGLPGDWRVAGTQLFTDELATGIGYTGSSSNLMSGIAARFRPIEHEVGAEIWLRYDLRRMTIHAQATTLGRIATLVAQRTVLDKAANRLLAGTTVRATPARTDAGAALTWRHTGGRPEGARWTDLSFDLTVEGYATPDNPGGRLLLGMSW